MPTIFHKEYLVAVDSDGCAFDVMKWKHLHAFIPEAVAVFGLEKYGDLYQEAAKRVNLYSDLRGCNRFIALYCGLKLAQKHLGQPLPIPDLEPLREFLLSGQSLSRGSILKWREAHPAPVLDKALEWSDRTNARIASDLKESPAFPSVRETLANASAHADILVCSAAAKATLVQEWAAAGLDTFVTMIAGQENGSKSEQLASAIRSGGFPQERVLMIGDAPGDHQAATATGAWFFPIVPGEEEDSWQRCRDEAVPAFFGGAFNKAVEQRYVKRFYQNLPACEVRPPA